MEPTGSACHAVVRWVITPLAASPASFQPSKAAMMTGAVSLPVPLSSIAHHLLARRLLGMPVLAYVLHHGHWLSCRSGTAWHLNHQPRGTGPPQGPGAGRRLTGPAFRLGTL